MYNKFLGYDLLHPSLVSTVDCCAVLNTHCDELNAVSLVVLAKCLTVIDHDNPGDNKIWVTTHTSDFRTGCVLSFGPTWETARPVAYDSMQLKGVQL